MTKFSIDSFYDRLDQVLQMPDSVFIAENKNDQSLYNLILSFAHFFNNLRDVMIIQQLVNSELKAVDKTNNPKYGQFGGMIIFTDNLFFAFILEFIELLRNNKKLIESDKFNKIVKLTKKQTQDDWRNLLKFARDSNNKIYKTLLGLRNNLSFHYYQPKKIFEGYQIATQNPKNKMFLSLGSKVSETRYYFYDLANQIAIYKTIADNELSLDDWRKKTDKLINIILSVTMNVIHKFITSRGAPSITKTEKIQPIKNFLRKI